MGDRYEEKADTIVKEWAAAQDEGLIQLQQRVAAALREQDRWYAIDDPEHPPPKDGTPFLAATWIRGQLRWRVVVRIWQRWYDDKDGPPFEIWARLMLPAPPPDPGRDTVTPRDTGEGDG